jgi:hypothetical protein
MNGTVQQISAQLTKLNPNWKQDFNVNNVSNNVSAASLADEGTWAPNPCNNRWQSWFVSAFEEGITYLREVPHKPAAGPGPGQCGRVSCSYKAAIWWCNDVFLTITSFFCLQLLTLFRIQPHLPLIVSS